ncbi:MAG: phage tail protein [Roseburia sp.]|nr:phage tail protein [Roseburia sp.]
MNHGVYVSQKGTSVGTPVVAEAGIPFFIGIAPVQSAANPAKPGVPVLCTSWAEAKEKLGYSDDWKTYTLCEAMYSHFQLFGCQPAIFCSVLDMASMTETVAASDVSVADHKARLPIEAIDNEALVVKISGGAGNAYVKGVDYDTYYDGEFLVIEAQSTGAFYDAEAVNVAYKKVITTPITPATIATNLESIEQCLTLFGIVPDLICAPGYSHISTVAAVMATKASGINGMFTAKALIDIDTGADGAKTYDAAIPAKAAANVVDAGQVVCWPVLTLGNMKFHMSTQLAGLMAQVDTDNGGTPYESPSNKGFQCDGVCLEDGTEVNLTLAQANILNSNGITTALNFMGGWKCWGNYTACYPANTDVKDYFIPVSRMFGWVGNTLIKTFWSRLDKPMNRRLIDTIMDTANIWLNGLVGAGYLLGARVEFSDEENPLTALMAGIVKLHVYMTPPSPAQEIDFVLEYDASYVTSALQA